MELKDQLSWDEFLKESSKVPFIYDVKPFNRLIAHTKNLFIIAGYGSFTKGYVLIITKDFLPSFGLVNEQIYEELIFLIKLLKNNIEKKYKRKAVVFEHGMCACIGGLDRAHIHIMSIDTKSNSESLKSAIERVLYKRKVGIKYISFGKYKLENIHDINQFMEDNDENNKDFEIEGKLFKLNDIKNLDTTKWPLVTLNHIKKGGHYVYFDSGYPLSSFLTTENFQTQFGRQVVFENEMNLSRDFKKTMETYIDKNPMLEPWKWQSLIFEENIIQTVNETRNTLKNYTSMFRHDYEKFELKIL